VAGNKKSTSSPTDNDCSGAITSQGYNLTGNSTGCSISGTGDVTVSPSTVFTSVLGSLANNGGQTYTHLLYGGNAAMYSIPSGTNSCGSGSFAADQRGDIRPYSTNCDMGAYESQDALPTVSMSSAAGNPTSTSPILVTVTFSESVTGFTAGDITPGNGTANNFAGSGASYSFDLTPSGDGAVTADIAAGVAQDSALNNNTAATQFSRTYDTTAPSVTSFTATSPTNSLNIPITAFAASDAVGVSAYLITGSATPPSAGAAGWSGSAPTSYIVASDGAYTIYPWAKDAAGNISAVYGSPASVTVDTTAPTVVSITRANDTPTNAASVNFIVTFSENVSDVDTSDFSLVNGAGLTGASVTGVSGSGTTYTISVNTGSGSDDLRLDLHDDDSITDGTGNQLGGSGLANGNFLTGELFTIDQAAPTAGSLVAAKVTTAGGTTYSFTVDFSDNLAIDVTSLDGSDIRVTEPGGFNQLATLVGVTPPGNGARRTATYQITAPGGAWDSADSGAYTIAQKANQVFDTAGNAVGATTLGSFQISLNYTVYLPLVMR
jgi:Bacterial Ig-like domain